MPHLANPKWEIAVLAYVGGATQHEAYLQAGFRGTQPAAAKMFKNGLIKARVLEIRHERDEMARQARQKAAEDATVDEAWVIRHLKHNTLAALRGDPVYDRKGQPTGHYRPDRMSANKGLELLGRTRGMFIDRTELGNPGDFSRMADEELDAKIIETAKELGLPAPALKMLEHLTKKAEAAE